MSTILVDNAIDPALVETLARETGLDVAVAPPPNDEKRALPRELIADVRATLTTFLPENHAEMAKLELVQLCSAGFAQVERLGLSTRRVNVCTASGVNDVPIAEWSVAMMVNLARDLPGLFRNQQQGIWDRAARFQTEIRGRTLGIWGYGGIGREVARIAKAMGLRVHVLTRSGRADDGVERYHIPGTADDAGTLPDQVFSPATREAFCRSLDFLLLAMPQTPENVGIIDRQIFEWMGPHAFLLNPARGPLVVEADLLDALTTGRIAGAALDTHFKYPLPAEHPLWRMPNVIMTPHISGSFHSPHFRTRLWALFRENVARWQGGRPLLNALPAARLDPA